MTDKAIEKLVEELSEEETEEIVVETEDSPEGDYDSLSIEENPSMVTGRTVDDGELELKPDLPSVHKIPQDERVKIDVQKIAAFLDDIMYPLIEQSYREDLHEDLKLFSKLIFEVLHIAKQHDLPMGTFPLSLDSLGRIIPLIADEVQSRLDAYRPAGKAAAQKALGMMLKNSMIDNVCHVNDMFTAYTVLDATEEFVLFEISKTRVSSLSFKTDEGKINKSVSPAQFKTIPIKIIMRWDEIKNIILAPLVELTEDGKHPEFKDVIASIGIDGNRPTSGVGSMPGLVHLKNADSVLAEAIMQSSVKDLSIAVKMAKQNNIDPSSIAEMMASIGYKLSSDMSHFEEAATTASLVDPQTELPAQTVPQGPDTGQVSEASSLLSFLKN